MTDKQIISEYYFETVNKHTAYGFISEAKVTGDLDPAGVEAEAGRLCSCKSYRQIVANH